MKQIEIIFIKHARESVKFYKEVLFMGLELYEGLETIINDLISEYREYIEQDRQNGDDPSFNQGAIEALEEL